MTPVKYRYGALFFIVLIMAGGMLLLFCRFFSPWQQRETDDFGPGDIAPITTLLGAPFPASTQYLHLRMSRGPDGTSHELKVRIPSAELPGFIRASVLARAERLEGSGLGFASGTWWNPHQYDFVQYKVEFPRPVDRPADHGSPCILAFATQPPGDSCFLYIEYVE